MPITKISELIQELKKQSSTELALLLVLSLLSIAFLHSLFSQSAELYTLFESTGKWSREITQLERRDNLITHEVINTWYSFGEPPLEGTAPSQYKLLGVQVSSSGSANMAFITTDNGEADVYSVGDKLADGAIITSIEANQVIILRAGVPKKLLMPRYENLDTMAPIIKNEGG